MTPRSSAPHPSARLRAVAPVAVLALLALTACTEEPETDTRPVSSADEFFDAVESLEAVESIDHADATTDAGAAPADDAADPARSVVHLHEDADSVQLRVAERDLLNLYNDYQYPDGAPQLTIVSGDFRIEAPQRDSHTRVDGAHEALASALNLPQLPHLAALPDVESGELESTRATAQLEPGTDLRDWVLDNADAAGSVRLTVAAETSTALTTTSFSFSLGSDTTAEAAQTLFETADSGGATLLSGSVGDRTSQQTEYGDLHVPALDDVTALHEELTRTYGATGTAGFSVRTGDDVALDLSGTADQLEDVLEAEALLAEAGARLRTADTANGDVAVSVADADGLRRVITLITDADWLLDPEADIEVAHREHLYHGVQLEAPEWRERGELVASLWDAGFTAVRDTPGARSSAFGLTVSDSAGPDVTDAAGRDALVAALRGGGWSGEATITVDHGDDSVTFMSTATGRADRAYNGRRGTDADPPPWGEEILTAWNATAS